MCFDVSTRWSEKFSKKAKENIDCYKTIIKTVDGKYFSNIENYPYILGHINKSIDLKKESINTLIDVFSPKVITEGYHSYIIPPSLLHMTSTKIIKDTSLGNVVLCKCIIPKGCKYYINTDKRHYVSENIVIEEEIVDPVAFTVDLYKQESRAKILSLIESDWGHDFGFVFGEHYKKVKNKG